MPGLFEKQKTPEDNSLTEAEKRKKAFREKFQDEHPRTWPDGYKLTPVVPGSTRKSRP